MSIDYIPLIIFVAVTTFTPGPGNITSAAMGMLYGYKRTVRFLFGIVGGYLMIMMLCAFVSSEVVMAIPNVEPFLRIFGAAYLIWLAIGTARATYAFDVDKQQPMVFRHGFLLQALNPKAIIFGLTIYTTFLSSMASQPVVLTTSALILAMVTFCSVSLWAFGGAKIKGLFHLPNVRKWVNSVLVALLVYCAFSLSGF